MNHRHSPENRDGLTFMEEKKKLGGAVSEEFRMVVASYWLSEAIPIGWVVAGRE